MALDKDLRQAILEAAIAVEVALDGAYRRVAHRQPKLEPMISLVIKNQRSIREQMKEGALAVLHESYATASVGNYERINALMSERNEIVHNGAPGPTDTVEVERKLGSAYALFQWL